MAYTAEFTPELTQSFLAGRLADIGAEEAVQEGRATSEAASRGLAGQAYEASLVGQARAGAARAATDVEGQFNFDVANLNREERLTKEQRDYQDVTRNKEMNFQEAMAERGYSAERAAAHQKNIWSQQGLVTGLLGSAASGALGGYFASL